MNTRKMPDLDLLDCEETFSLDELYETSFILDNEEQSFRSGAYLVPISHETWNKDDAKDLVDLFHH
jgi:hypothetical protein